MRTLRRLLHRASGIFGHRRDADLDAELQSYIHLLADDYERSGMPPAEAERAARLKLGGIENTKESYRDQRGLPQLETLLLDIRFSLRSLGRRPAFTCVAVLSLGIGIGFNATIFSWFRAVYLNPAPGVRDARELLTINAAFRDGDGMSNSYSDYLHIREGTGLFSGIFAHEMEFVALRDGASTDFTAGGIVTGNYFDVLGVPMARGRAFLPHEDEAPDRNPVVVLSHGLWQRRFGSSENIIGKRLELNRVPFTVVGVTAPGFVGVYGGIRQDFWVPLHMARSLDAQHRDRLNAGSWLQIMGRPVNGVTLGAIQARLDVISSQISQSHRKDSPDYRAIAYPLHRAQRGFHSGLFELVRVLAIAVGIVLLLACLNVANLLIARAAERSREMSLRMSLGANRARLVRQLFTESTVLAMMGGIMGLAIAWLIQPLPGILSRSDLALELNAGVDWGVVAFLFGVSFAAAVIFGFLPALETTRVNLVNSLKEGAASTTSGSRRNLWRNALVVSQVALSMTAIVGAVLFGVQLVKITTADKGFRADRLLTAGTDLFAAGVAESRAPEFYRGVMDQMTSLPEVESAAWTTFLPMSGSGGGNRRALEVQGFTPADGKPLSVVVDIVSPAYLRTMGIRLVAGREFEWTDDDKSQPVALVNQAFVNHFFQGRGGVGSTIRIGGTWRTIAGVHRNYIYRSPQAPLRPAVLLPFPQEYPTRGAIAVVRSRSDPSRVAIPLRSTIQAFDRNLALNWMMTMEENIAYRFLDNRIATAVLALFSAIACLLAAIGLYGVLWTFVNQRRREFGIRMALGAAPADLTQTVLRRTTALTAAGLVCGFGLSYAFASLLQTALTAVDPFAPWVHGTAAAMVSVMAFGAAFAPWRSVIRMDPSTALRQD